MDDARLFRRTDADFPVTRAVQQRLVEAGRVEGEGPLAARAVPAPAGVGKDRGAGITGPASPEPDGPSIPLGEAGCSMLHLDLNRMLAGRCLIQGSSGAGKSMTLRHLVEEAHDYLTTMIIDPENKFDGLAKHIGAPSTRTSELRAPLKRLTEDGRRRDRRGRVRGAARRAARPGRRAGPTWAERRSRRQRRRSGRR